VIRCHQLDGVVLMVECDKTTPGIDHGGDRRGCVGDFLYDGGDDAAGVGGWGLEWDGRWAGDDEWEILGGTCAGIWMRVSGGRLKMGSRMIEDQCMTRAGTHRR